MVFTASMFIYQQRKMSVKMAKSRDKRIVDNAVSKTINLPAEAAPDAVAKVYREAYHLGLKGITIYRYGSIAQQVQHRGMGEEPYEKEHASKCDPYQCKL
jgi:ribonucleotide reductase alpha subunit